MQDDPPEDTEDEFDGWLVVPHDVDDMFSPELSEDDDFLIKKFEAALAPGMTQGTYVGEYGDSGIFPDKDHGDDISYFDQRFSAFTTFLLFACLVVMLIVAIFLICMFLGYV